MTCEGCKFWSEVIARSADRFATIEALCLNKESPQHGAYTSRGCDKYVRGEPLDVIYYPPRSEP